MESFISPCASGAPGVRHDRCGRSVRLACLLVGFVLALGTMGSAAQTIPRDSDVTLYGSYRDGGSFADAVSNQSLRLHGSSAWALSYDRGLDGRRQLQFYLAYQNTRLELKAAAGTSPPANPAPAALSMRVVYLQFGGTNYFDGTIGQGPYVVGGIGASLFQPGSSGYGDVVRPSMNLGIGYQAALGERLALRLEARGYVTLVNSSGGLFCSGGCVLKIKADTVSQGEAQLGLAYRF